jgi:hypothetical protein
VALRIFDLADIWARRTGHDVRLVSANDHVHSRRSAHYEGRAVDLHGSALGLLAEAMRGMGYTVLWRVPGHYSHVHVEASTSPAGHVLARVTDARLARRESGAAKGGGQPAPLTALPRTR